MCELFAVSTCAPAKMRFSLRRLAAHGSRTGLAHDGWGVAFYQGHDAAIFREPSPAADSSLVRFLERRGPCTTLAISHIRHATWGAVNFANTQPFHRELGGRTHAFAHNGYLADINAGHSEFKLGVDQPIGQTDSEFAFCALLRRIRRLWLADELPSLAARLAVLNGFAAELRALGAANFLYADGDALFAHSDRRAVRLGGPIEPPGLWLLERRSTPKVRVPVEHAGVTVAHGESAAVLVASLPLTDEAWQPMSEGELIAVKGGQIIATFNLSKLCIK